MQEAVALPQEVRWGGDRHMDLCFPGSSDISGPEAVRGLVGGSLTVQCHYVQKWKNSKKWWCRGANWGNCHILVKTNGSEQEVQRKNVSIKDNQKNLIFTVTMEKLKQTDANIYWCGIERYGIDLGVKVKVTVHPGKSMCKCGCVPSGPSLSWALRFLSSDFSVTQSELSHRVVES